MSKEHLKTLIAVFMLFIACKVLFAQNQTNSTRLGNLSYPEMVFVEGGTFTMGDEWNVGDSKELPTHEVTLKNFKISKTEITVKQYRKYCKETGNSMPITPAWGWNDNYPITNIKWHDAVAYCDWLSIKLNGIYRLPSEAEWEFAARGGKHSKGFKYSGSQNIQLVCSFNGNTNEQPVEIASKKSNELGIYDMSGNAIEWCNDRFSYVYYENSPKINPRGSSTSPFRANRGGCFMDDAKSCRVTARWGMSPDQEWSCQGFRVVVSL